MCGIVGLIVRGGSERELGARVQEMAGCIEHRGPDGGGVAAFPEIAIGMKRLAIVDVVHGEQPMANDDGSVVLVYNGEIYNAPALRERLKERGATFRTRSDTEVILRAYEADPDTFERDLAGMWAVCIYDRRRGRVLLSRDRFGIKPYFLLERGPLLAFASEMSAFRALREDPHFGPMVAPAFELDRSAAHAFLSWGYVPENDTIYRGIRRLPPATRISFAISELGESTHPPHAYWTLTPARDAERVTRIEDACELVEQVLRRAIREHLESDVPIAAFLSGGIDSSLVAAYARDASSLPIQGFTIGFREPRFDESPFAVETGSKLDMSVRVTTLDEAAFLSALPKVLAAYDEPFGDSSSIATYLLSDIVQRTHKVALGGDGGDEAFAGYAKHRIVGFRESTEGIAGLRRVLGRMVERMPASGSRESLLTESSRLLHRVARGLAPSDAEAYVALTQMLSLDRTRPLIVGQTHANRYEHLAADRFRRTPGTQLARTLACDLTSPLPNDMLTKVDRASMARHLEVRVPFLDHRVVEVGVGLTPEFTLGRTSRGPKGKRVLRALHERRFGKALSRRPKMGFGVPIESWLRGSLAPVCDELFSEARLAKHGLLDPAALAGGRWRAWAASEPRVTFSALALAAWLEVNEGSGAGGLLELFARMTPR